MYEKKKLNKYVISQLEANKNFSKKNRKCQSRYSCLTDLNNTLGKYYFYKIGGKGIINYPEKNILYYWLP